MNDKTKDKSSNNKAISPFAMDKTYGEKKYDFWVNTVLNFGVNLTASAALTYWATHSSIPFKLPFMKKELPAPMELQRRLTSWFEKTIPLKIFSDVVKEGQKITPRGKVAGILANLFTLNIAGHVVLIPTIWLGAKIRPAFVRNEDRKHYGDEAMQSDDLKARHAAIDAEERPTFLGAIVARIGTILAIQFTGFTVGSDNNILKWIGKKTPLKFLTKYNGADEIIGILGNNLGSVVEELVPNTTKTIDGYLASHGITYSDVQKNYNTTLANAPYKNSAQHFGKYLAQDVLYSAIAATSSGPAINFVKKFIPGLTYKPQLSAETAALATSVPTRLTTSQANTNDDNQAKAAESVGPRTRINSISKDETVRPRMDQQLTPTTG